MTPWRVARSLDTLLEEINDAAPNRSKVSDGSIGDAAHASRDSDHNPWVVFDGTGIVRARDFTHDPQGGLDCNILAVALADLLRTGAHPACRSGAYVIWNRRILSADRRSEGWRAYTGSNPHDHHLHLSVALAQSGYDSTAPWHVTATPQEDDMTPEQAKQLASIAADVNGLQKAFAAFREAERGRDQKLLQRVADMSDSIAGEVVDKLAADQPAGASFDPGQLKRIVTGAVITGVRQTLGSLDEP